MPVALVLAMNLHEADCARCSIAHRDMDAAWDKGEAVGIQWVRDHRYVWCEEQQRLATELGKLGEE